MASLLPLSLLEVLIVLIEQVVEEEEEEVKGLIFEILMIHQ
jgi:hypothetical protein